MRPPRPAGPPGALVTSSPVSPVSRRSASSGASAPGTSAASRAPSPGQLAGRSAGPTRWSSSPDSGRPERGAARAGPQPHPGQHRARRHRHEDRPGVRPGQEHAAAALPDQVARRRPAAPGWAARRPPGVDPHPQARHRAGAAPAGGADLPVARRPVHTHQSAAPALSDSFKPARPGAGAASDGRMTHTRHRRRGAVPGRQRPGRWTAAAFERLFGRRRPGARSATRSPPTATPTAGSATRWNPTAAARAASRWPSRWRWASWTRPTPGTPGWPRAPATGWPPHAPAGGGAVFVDPSIEGWPHAPWWCPRTARPPRSSPPG